LQERMRTEVPVPGNLRCPGSGVRPEARKRIREKRGREKVPYKTSLAESPRPEAGGSEIGTRLGRDWRLRRKEKGNPLG